MYQYICDAKYCTTCACRSGKRVFRFEHTVLQNKEDFIWEQIFVTMIRLS